MADEVTYLDLLWKALTNRSFLFFFGASVMLYALIFKQEGANEAVVKKIIDDNMATAIIFGPICAILIVLMAAIKHLDNANPGVSQDIIAGKYGELLAIILAAIMPGGAGGDQLNKAWLSGENRDNVLVCLTAMMGMSLNGFIFRSTTLGWRLSLIYAAGESLVILQVYCIAKLIKPWLHWL